MADPASSGPPIIDLYAKWSLPRDATPEEVTEKRRELRQEWHSDRIVAKEPERVPEYEQRSKEVGEDFATLEDPEQREAYDRVLTAYERAQAEDAERDAAYQRRAARAAADPDRADEFQEAFAGQGPRATDPGPSPPRSSPPPPPSPPPRGAAPSRPPRRAGLRPATVLTLGFWAFVLFLGYEGCSALSELGDDGGSSPQAESSDRQPGKAQASEAVSVSRYKHGGYRAIVRSVDRHRGTFDVQFTATGTSALVRPRSSCVEVGGLAIPAETVDLSTNLPGRYVGTMRFPYAGAGKYGFRYACRKDYSFAPLFARDKRADRSTQTLPGVLGVSRYSSDYYAAIGPVVLHQRLFVVSFEASGYSDLRNPRESCVEVNGHVIRPADLVLPVNESDHYRGRFTFTYQGSGTYRFVYSCQADYSAVTLFER
jgi:curved DNA-binding protein CbpA